MGKIKAEVACSEGKVIGTPDEEAHFASQEGVKCPPLLATITRENKSGADHKFRYRRFDT
ncbi:hypothetical protein TU51_14150 [Bacillus cytotoxicus]|nr:hypothetical protein CG482_021465 [Bacillus cytotoxicus]AWC38691.1 hypothetical protein CG481_021300 [Bacillus cytotoxicus]AWC46668.1 hypothetical protein CG479_020605 [Bacillus cytotoxicus]AWC62910.1 hypothetical protein CG474_021025 [Bacillus cytotoxicus]KMT49713.1 hypothetical protein TU51_14150 [Bacillus cytotoxicus]